jgi:hypothetical protein
MSRHFCILPALGVLCFAGATDAHPTPKAPAATTAVPATACLIVNGPAGNNVAFNRAKSLDKADKEKDGEYGVYERGTYKGVTFYLRSGHGVVVMEAWIKGKRVASTFFSLGRDPENTDHLSLEVLGKGGYVEAACTNTANSHGW